MLAERIATMQRLCFDEEPSEMDLAALGDRNRWLVYRDLVRKRLKQVVGAALPRTKHALGEAGFGTAVASWMAVGGPKAKYFRDVPSDFFHFSIERESLREPCWLEDLARFEIACWEVRAAPPCLTPAYAFTFDRRPIVSPAMQILRLSHPVHRLPTPTPGYVAEPAMLCVYRNLDHESAVWELNALAADLFRAWSVGESSVTESVHQVAAQHRVEIGPVFVDKLAALIADAIDRGIILEGTDRSQ